MPSGSLRSTLTLTPPTNRPRLDPTLHLHPGVVVRNAITSRSYRVVELLGAGGFGAAYRVAQVSGPAPLLGGCVLKVSIEPGGWHREAYFGDLLKDTSGVVRVHESFAWMPRGEDRKPLYCLISELVEGGDLSRYLADHPQPWPESRARREVIRLLRAVTLLHASGAVHRDITPNNVFVTRARVLKLGDFGIALHRVGKRDVRADAFAPGFAPPAISVGKNGSWRPADDVYHLGQLLAMLLCGKRSKLTAADAKDLDCGPQTKSVIQRCIGERRKRFASAVEMLRALEKQEKPPRRASVRSLNGKRVVFTGELTIVRAKARTIVKKAGGIVESGVGRQTDVLVVGEQSPNWKAEKKGQKLLDVDHERELGHHIAVIKERRFQQLTGYK